MKSLLLIIVDEDLMFNKLSFGNITVPQHRL